MTSLEEYLAKITEANLDIATLSNFVNDETAADLTSRLGATYPNLIKLIEGIQAKDTQAIAIVAAMQARINAADDASLINTVLDAKIATGWAIHRHIYVDSSLSSNGDGSIGSPFNNPKDAVLDSQVDRVNIIYLKPGQDHYLGSAAQSTATSKTVIGAIDIIFNKWGSGSNPNLILPFFNHSNGNSYSSFRIANSRLGDQSRVAVSGYDVNIKTVAATNPAVSSSGNFMYGTYGMNMAFYWKGVIELDGDTNLINPFYRASRLDLGLAYTQLKGSGNLVGVYSGGVPTLFTHFSLSREASSTACVFSHARGTLNNRPNILVQSEPSFMVRNNN